MSADRCCVRCSPTIATKTTTRLYGADAFEEAISITQHIWPAALPENAPNLVPDRPRAVTLLTPDDPLTAPLSHLGFHAPLLFTNSATTLPTNVDAYFKSVEPTFLVSPADGPYNMTYTIGSWGKISWSEELQVEYDSEMGNRRDVALNTGGRYADSQP